MSSGSRARARRPTEVYEAGFLGRLHPEFTIIQPAGKLMHRAEIADGLRGAYGGSPDFRIAIRNVVVLREVENVIIATYEEWQRNAVNSSPPDNGRAATVVFDGGLWRHVHETWLPEDVMRAGPFDF